MSLDSYKKVTVVARRSPFNSVKSSEALRQSVGLTMSDNEITLLLLDAGAWLAVPHSPEVIGGGETRQHIEALCNLGGKVKVEAESLKKYGIDEKDILPCIEIASNQEIVLDMASADVVITF